MSTRITALGSICALGDGVEVLWQGAVTGATALAPPRHLRLDDLPAVLVGEAMDPTAPEVDRAFLLAERATFGALKGRVLDPATALVVASTKGGVGLAQAWLEDRASSAVLRAAPLWHLGARLAEQLGLRGPVCTISVACASGTAALGHGHRLLESGRAPAALVVGVDGASEFIVRGFASLRALSKGPARPFDGSRSGLCVGEGAGAVLLEAGAGAARAHVLGYGASNDANHITGPARDGAGLQRAVRQSLDSAALDLGAVDAVSAHGTATRFNDAMEGVAFSTLFGERTVPVHSIKGAIGHSLGAAGLVEAVLCVRGLEAGAWPPVAGLRTLDPDIPLDVVQGAPREGDLRVVVSTSSGFSGINSAVVLCRA